MLFRNCEHLSLLVITVCIAFSVYRIRIRIFFLMKLLMKQNFLCQQCLSLQADVSFMSTDHSYLMKAVCLFSHLKKHNIKIKMDYIE